MKIYFFKLCTCNIVFNTGETSMTENEFLSYARKFSKRIVEWYECRIDGKICK